MNRHSALYSPRIGRGVLFIAVLLLAQGCASAGAGAGTGSGSGNVITREQINPDDENAYVIVRRIRPTWLRPRSQESITGLEPTFPQVFLDELQVGDVDYLYRIDAAQIDRIEYFSALDATTRYGTGYAGGLIIVRTINSGG